MGKAGGNRGTAGIALIEALIGIVLVTVFFIAIWFHYRHNQEIWSRGRDKILLQQALSQASEAITRDARAGAGVVVNGASDISILDRGGNTIRRYYRDGSSGLLVTTGGQPVVPEACAAVTFTMDPDTTEIRYVLTLKDPWENRATVSGSAHLRNLSEN